MMRFNERPADSRSGQFWAVWTMAWLTVAAAILTHWVSHHEVKAAVGHASVDPTPPRPTTKSIESIEPGDIVLARDDHTGIIAPRRVLRVFHNTADHLRLVRVRAQSGAEQVIKTTDEHPFFVSGYGWLAAKALVAGLKVLQSDGKSAEILATDRESHPEGVPVFNFEVEKSHTYYVGARLNAPLILVHNACSKPNGAAADVPNAANPGSYLAGKAPRQVTPGVRVLEGQYVDDRGRVQPWRAHYDEYGRQVARTDFNAGNIAQGIPEVHYHTYEYNARYPHGREAQSHIPGEYQP